MEPNFFKRVESLIAHSNSKLCLSLGEGGKLDRNTSSAVNQCDKHVT
jgi:hypothetical protein